MHDSKGKRTCLAMEETGETLSKTNQYIGVNLQFKMISSFPGSTVSAKQIVDAFDPNFRGTVRGNTGDTELAEAGCPTESLEGEVSEPDKGSCTAFGFFLFRGGRVFPRFLPTMTWLRMNFRNCGLGFSTLVETTKCSPIRCKASYFGT